MTLRKWTYTRMITHAPITNTIPAGRIVSSGAVGLPGSPSEELEKPFMVIRAADRADRIGAAISQRFLIWVHDDVGSYTSIDDVLEAVRIRMLTGENVVHGSTRVSCVEWEGSSDDLYDDALGTATRWESFRLTGRAVGS